MDSVKRPLGTFAPETRRHVAGKTLLEKLDIAWRIACPRGGRASMGPTAGAALNLRKVARAAREGNADELSRAIQQQVDLGFTPEEVAQAETGGWVRLPLHPALARVQRVVLTSTRPD